VARHDRGPAEFGIGVRRGAEMSRGERADVVYMDIVPEDLA